MKREEGRGSAGEGRSSHARSLLVMGRDGGNGRKWEERGKGTRDKGQGQQGEGGGTRDSEKSLACANWNRARVAIKQIQFDKQTDRQAGKQASRHDAFKSFVQATECAWSEKESARGEREPDQESV